MAGFSTHSGCSARCPYCIEAGTQVFLKKPDDVAWEVSQLIDLGHKRLHLADPEFNENLTHATSVLKAMRNKGVKIPWVLYMKPGTYSPELFSLLKDTGAMMCTLSVDTAGRDEKYWRNVSGMIGLAKDNGIRIAVDFLSGLPGESEDIFTDSLEKLEKAGPDNVVINTVLRLAKHTPMTNCVLGTQKFRKHIIGNPDGSLLEPVFYSHLSQEHVARIVGDNKLFMIAGAKKGVNYQFD